jgi:hypothetical protein
MERSASGAADSASEQISRRIEELGDWRRATSPGAPGWSHDGIVCTGETYKSAVKLTFAKGASLKDPACLFNSGLGGNVRRAIDIKEEDTIDEDAFKNLIRDAVALNGKSKRHSS